MAEAGRGNPQGALDLIELGMWDEMATLSPLVAPLAEWQERSDEIAPGIQIRQLWGEIAANWAGRQTDLGKERINEIMLQARICLDQAGTNHPVLLHELAWLYDEVTPKDYELARQLRLRVRDMLGSEIPAVDGAVRSHHLRIQSELIEDTSDCLRLLDLAAEASVGDPLSRYEAARTWMGIRFGTRKIPQLDLPAAQHHMSGSRMGGGRLEEMARFLDGIVRMADECGDPPFVKEVSWAFLQMTMNMRLMPRQFLASWAKRAADADTLANDRVAAARATALWLAFSSEDADLSPVEWQLRLSSCETAMGNLPGAMLNPRIRLLTFRGLALSRLHKEDAFEAFLTAQNVLKQQVVQAGASDPWAALWVDLAHSAAAAQPGQGAIHDLAIEVYITASERVQENHALYADTRRELARFAWNDDPQTQQEAIRVFQQAASAFAQANRWKDQEATLLELADRLRQAGDDIQATSAILDAADAWRKRISKPGDKNQQRAEELERLAGLRSSIDGEPPKIDPAQDQTQGPRTEALKNLIPRLETAPNAVQRLHIYQLVLRLFLWPDGNHRLDVEHGQAMAAEWHLSSEDCQRLTAMDLAHGGGFLIQIIEAVGHRPLAPVLARGLQQAELHEFGVAAAEAYRVIAKDSPALAAQLAPTAIDLTWGDSCRFVIAKAASVLPPQRFIALCQDLLARSKGENRGILSHLINILARDPRNLPVDDLRRLVDSAEWRDDRNEALWALALLGDKSLGQAIPRLLGDPDVPADTQAYAMEYGVLLRLPSLAPAITAGLSARDPDIAHALQHPMALIGSLALALPIDQTLIQEWMREAWGNDPDSGTLAFEGPPQRYRILSAALTRWLTTHDEEAWRIIEQGVAHPWRRYRWHLIADAGLSRHPQAFATVMGILALEQKTPETDDSGGAVRKKGLEVYLRSLSLLDLDVTQRDLVKRLLGCEVPPPAPPHSPCFDDATRPCDGGLSAPLWPSAVGTGPILSP